MEIGYLETTFFSFYHDERPAPAIVAMRDWTRQFWDERRNDFALVTSAAVLDELRKGGAHHKKPALDLALASFHQCDYLVTWNCRHLANASKFGHIRRINTMLGLKTPELVTPPELLGDIES